MNTDNIDEFFNDYSIKLEVERLWSNVMQATSSIVANAQLFGFDEIELKSNPNIHLIIAVTATLEFMLDRAIEDIDCSDAEGVGHGQVRMLLNARQNIVHMKEVATALRFKDRDMYDEAIERLSKQAQI